MYRFLLTTGIKVLGFASKIASEVFDIKNIIYNGNLYRYII